MATVKDITKLFEGLPARVYYAEDGTIKKGAKAVKIDDRVLQREAIVWKKRKVGDKEIVAIGIAKTAGRPFGAKSAKPTVKKGYTVENIRTFPDNTESFDSYKDALEYAKRKAKENDDYGMYSVIGPDGYTVAEVESDGHVRTFKSKDTSYADDAIKALLKDCGCEDEKKEVMTKGWLDVGNQYSVYEERYAKFTEWTLKYKNTIGGPIFDNREQAQSIVDMLNNALNSLAKVKKATLAQAKDAVAGFVAEGWTVIGDKDKGQDPIEADGLLQEKQGKIVSYEDVLGNTMNFVLVKSAVKKEQYAFCHRCGWEGPINEMEITSSPILGEQKACPDCHSPSEVQIMSDYDMMQMAEREASVMDGTYKAKKMEIISTTMATSPETMVKNPAVDVGTIAGKKPAWATAVRIGYGKINPFSPEHQRQEFRRYGTEVPMNPTGGSMMVKAYEGFWLNISGYGEGVQHELEATNEEDAIAETKEFMQTTIGATAHLYESRDGKTQSLGTYNSPGGGFELWD